MTVNKELCIVDGSKIRKSHLEIGVILEEGILLSKYFDRVHIVVFHELKKIRVEHGNRVIIHMIPIPIKSAATRSFYVLSNLLNTLFLFFALVQIVRKNKIGILRAQDALRTGLPALFVGKVTKTPVVIKCAGSIVKTVYHTLIDKNTNRYTVALIIAGIKIMKRIVFSTATWTFAVDSETAKLSKNYGAKKITQIGIFLDHSLFHPVCITRNNERTRLLYVGRLDPAKGLKYLIKAASAFKESNVEFIIVGEGVQREQLENMIADLNLRGIVKLIGEIPHSRLPLLYNSADIFVLPSLTEGTPIALLEAMACGLPVVTTSVGVIPKLFKNEIHALIISPKNVESLVYSIQKLIADHKLRERISKNALNYVKDQFTKERWLNKQMMVYRHLVQKENI